MRGNQTGSKKCSKDILKLLFTELTGREFCFAIFEIDIVAQVHHYKIGFVDVIGGCVKMFAAGGDPLPVGLLHTQIDILPLDGGRQAVFKETLFHRQVGDQVSRILPLSRGAFGEVVHIGLNAE